MAIEYVPALKESPWGVLPHSPGVHQPHPRAREPDLCVVLRKRLQPLYPGREVPVPQQRNHH